VHLVLPTPTALRLKEHPASASVVLTLKPGNGLAPDAVQGITYIVSNSVEQLASENVAVMDDAGHVLSVPASGMAGMTSRQLEMQRSVEEYLGEKVEGLLGTMVGTGHARAQVSAQLSFDQVDRTVDSFDPEGQVLESEQKSETGSSGGAGSQTVVNNGYQNSRKLEKIIGSVGNIQRLTVAVLVDEKAIQKGASFRVEQLDAMVRNAVGADSARGDRVSVIAVPFETPAAATPGAGSEPVKADPIVLVERVSRPLIGVVALAVIALLAWRTLAAFSAMSRPAAGGSPLAGGSMTFSEEGTASGAAELRQRMASDAGERPEATARVVRAWLAES